MAGIVCLRGLSGTSEAKLGEWRKARTLDAYMDVMGLLGFSCVLVGFAEGVCIATEYCQRGSVSRGTLPKVRERVMMTAAGF